MTQQLAIIVLIDVAAALKARTLKDNTYLFDNMKLQGSENEGTGDLVTAINGSYWFDGSQAEEQVMNWLPYALGAIPPTVPRSFYSDRTRDSDQEALAALTKIAATPGTNIVAELDRIKQRLGTRASVKSVHRAGHVRPGHKILDLRGEIVPSDSRDDIPELSNAAPVITGITGEAVDKQIIYPAQYGSPDLVTDGWYWSASVDTSRPGIYVYTMEIHLREPVWKHGGWLWEPVRMTFTSKIKVTSLPKRNGFTQADVGLLPLSCPGTP